MWFAEEDVFTFIGLPSKAIQLTKRTFLKKIASLFDPIGFLATFVVHAKLLQELWISGLEWDEELDEKLQERAIAWFQQLEGLNTIQIPCSLCLSAESMVSLTLHTFVDASEKAYGAVVYFRSVYEDGTILIRLVSANSKVAPLKAIYVPPLELM